ncbi:hypothetical protein [Komagataeibacter xylinus]|uniref:Uncharacterized protein n=1 Tax=Komagataeibacter xylinus TaxID=28448 RepID=A0A857FIZ1_KOMXY|nr:hypothetical protein [Komagataeibacter xylinus]QHC34123.1 hypothetical protein FMA36_00085 [Komagataeibacter xylinus]
MTTPWNGLPDQPERSGWHWLNDKLAAREALAPGYWSGRERVWMIGAWSVIDPKSVSGIFHYRGLCLSPSELAQMRKDERERAIAAVSQQEMKVDLGENQAAFNLGIHTAIAAIRTLTDDEGKKS